MSNKSVIGASIGNCVHVAGVSHFLAIAEKEGFNTIFLGPAVSVETIFKKINEYKPKIVALSYRLTPENVITLLDEVFSLAKTLDYEPIWVFGGTQPVAQKAQAYKKFSFISDGFDEICDSIRFLRGESGTIVSENYGSNLIERIENNSPYPILRHHFGLPSVLETVDGIEKIAKSKVVDVVSLGTDQNAQQFLFNVEKMQKQFDGAGGVPIRGADDLIRMKKASKCGNYPLMRCYSGTADVLKNAELLRDTIDNAWCAVPIFWYSELDGRGDRPIEVSIREAQELIKWHADRNIPVEINEPHHWGLRDSHDVMSVAMAYISAYNAKKLGVKNYISQYMFNNPNGISFSMDLARILAMVEVVESLHDENFKTYRETRAGLSLFHADIDIAKGQLAASTFMQMILKPHIIHVVGFCEADHAARPEEVIESCKIVRGVIRHTLEESFSIENDMTINKRKNELIREAKVLLNFICNKYSYDDDPLTNSEILADCVKKGYFDAVHILKNEKFRGNLNTTFIDGKCVAIDKESKVILTELERLKGLEKIND